MSEILFTCEHGGNKIIKSLKLKIPKNVLNSHQGYDIGALKIAKKMASINNNKIFYQEQSRLILDYNRSLHNHRVWSQYSKNLDENTREKLINAYQSYRTMIEGFIKKHHKIIHFAIHSFTPVLNGEIRNAEVGILFDPKKAQEKKIANAFKSTLKEEGIKVRFNYPYLGIADGLATVFRKKFKNYAGFEIEINQKVIENRDFQNRFLRAFNQLKI